MHPDSEKKKNKPLPILVAELPEIYQPIFGHPELSIKVSRSSDDRLAHILAAHDALKAMLNRPIRVLDLGCSQGYFSHHLASHGAVVHGIDFLNANIAVCQALADERGDAISIFETKTIDDTLAELKMGECDLVLGLSVFHHLIYEKGFEHVREIYRGLARKTLACLFELGLAEEPLYWGPSQPASPRQQLEDFAFVHEVSQIETHLSQIQRPLYFASNECWFFGKAAGVFDRWTTASNESAGDTHEGTRRFFFGNGLLIKQFRLDHAVRGHYNDNEWRNEIEFLRTPPRGMDLPKLIEFGKNSTDAWLLRESLPGESLDRKLAKCATDYDPHKVLRDILQQLVKLEAHDLYHNDVRTWNVLIDTEGRVSLIDYGAITKSREDIDWPNDVFLAFLIFLREVVCGEAANPAPRSPWLDPDALPEPYRRSVWKMLQLPKEKWSFAELEKTLAKNEGRLQSTTAPAGVSSIVQVFQHKYSQLYSHIASLETTGAAQREEAARLSKLLQVYQSEATALKEELSLTTSALATTRKALANEVALRNDFLTKRDSELSQMRDQLTKTDVWAKALEADAKQLEEKVAARDRELATEHSRSADLSQALARNVSWAASLEEDLIESNARMRAIYTSSSWRLTAPMRGIRRTARWMTAGARAWIMLKSDSRPRRIVRRAVNRLFDVIRSRPRLLGLTKAILVLAPPLRQRLQAAADPMRPFMTAITPPRWSGKVEHIPQPYDVKLVYNRLLHATKCVGESDSLELQTDSSKPRLAYLSPLPPVQSGIADFSAQFLPSLSEYYQIDVISSQGAVSDDWILANCSVRDVAWFERNAHRYDRILYHFGNSNFHGHMFPLLEKIPGVVVLHDFYLGNVVEYLQTHGGWTNFWTTRLVHSHGYSAIKLLLTLENRLGATWNYPTNFSVLDNAQGIIVHNEHARKLCAEFYPSYDANDWKVLPLAKSPNSATGREIARIKLGLPQNAFLVCSFGFAQSTKLNDRLLNAWLASSLADNAECYLVFVGGISEGAYGEELQRNIRSLLTSGRVQITGFVPSETYEDYLQAADIAVQLRAQSRGETSAAVLDCLAHGIPTIINAHGSMAELPHRATICLQDNFSDDDLTNALNDLWSNESLRSKVGQAGQKLIEECYAPGLVAKKYFNAIEKFASTNRIVDSFPLLVEYARSNTLQTSDTEKILDHSRELRRHTPIKRAAKRLFVDISVIVNNDFRTGIQRVVRAQLIELLKSPPLGYRIEPIWLHNDFGTWRYLYARNYMLGIFGLAQDMLSDEPIEVGEGDVFLGADFFTAGVIGAARLGLYDEWRARGIRIYFTVYDILPLTLPHRFPTFAEPIHAEWLSTIARVADALVCISESVAVETQKWLISHKISTSSQLAVVSCPLGGDIDASSPTLGLPDDAATTLDSITSSKCFLMVGTIEPRKGHLQTLDAFEELWQGGIDVKLVVVGARGWKGLPDNEARNIPLIIKRLKNHPERGRRLIWLDSVSDEYLEKIYAVCVCLIAASDDEGFGLPLIEAARHGLPIIARDIPVFREVAGDFAAYFKGSEGADLAEAIRSWLDLRDSGCCPDSSKIRWLTWEENVKRLKEILLASECAKHDCIDIPS